jgi:hypothetical protein
MVQSATDIYISQIQILFYYIDVINIVSALINSIYNGLVVWQSVSHLTLCWNILRDRIKISGVID